MAFRSPTALPTYLLAHAAKQAAQGISGETYDRDGVSGSQLLVSGQVQYSLTGFVGSVPVTNLMVGVNAASVGAGIVRLGVYDRLTLALLAQTADRQADFTTTGPKVLPLTAVWTPLRSDGYYCAIISVAATTQPNLLRSPTGVVGLGAFGTGAIAYGSQTGQADLPATAVINTSNVIGVHFAWS